jgi:signal transduction histidine kinase
MHTVLVVDDEPASRRAVERALADECRVIAAAGGAEALRRLDADPAALVVSDQRMPDMLGTRLLEECTLRHPQVVRVLLTAYAEVDTLLDAINAGHVWAYVTKPWEARELRLTVRRGLEHFNAEAERRQLMTELERSCRRASVEAEQKSRLLALAAHELGTPVHVAANAVELLAAGAAAEAQPWVDAARGALEWLARGVEQLHRAGQWRAGGPQLVKTRFDLGVMLGELIADYRPIAARRRLQLDFRPAAGEQLVDGDRRWLERAAGNLLSNAVRFTADGGRIAVTCDGGAIAVSDNGVGIAAELLPLACEPFSAAGGDIALHSSGRFEFGARGLGLGLATAKAVIEAHGGSITISSAVGQGTTVRLQLPLAGNP